MYRPQHTLPSLFLEEVESFLDSVTTKPGKLLVMGDFNVHCENIHSSVSNKFPAMLNVLGLDQRITEPTHEKRHILDLVITRQDEYDLVTDISVTPMDCFDHSTIIFKNFLKPWKTTPL